MPRHAQTAILRILERPPLPDVHARHVGNVRLVARRYDVMPAVGGFEGVFASSVCLSGCQHSVVTCSKQLDFNVPGEFAIAGNGPPNLLNIWALRSEGT